MTVGWVVGIALVAFWVGFAAGYVFEAPGRESDHEDKEAEK